MTKRWIFSILALSVFQGTLKGETQERELAGHLLEELGKILIIHEDRAPKEEGEEKAVVDEETEKKKPSPVRTTKKKKTKAHFAGTKKPLPEEDKKSSRLENEWVVSKTYPKTRKKKEEDLGVSSQEILPERPFAVASTEGKSKKNYQDLSERIDDLQSQVNFLSDEFGVTHHHAEMKAPHGIIDFFAEWLIWTTKEEGTEFAITTSSSHPGILQGAESQSIHFGWDFGVRAGMGVHLPQDDWDVEVAYTYFRPAETMSLQGNVTTLGFYQGATSDFEVVDFAKSDFSINFQLGDVVLGKSIPLTSRLLLRPFMGMRGAWIKQKNMQTFGSTSPYNIEKQNFFKGVGGLFGCESNWQLGSGVSFLANVGAALLAGRFDLYQTQKTPQNLYAVNWQDHFKVLSPMVQYVTGLGWDRNFHREKWHVGVALTFEGQYWWNQNQMPIFMDDILASYTHAQGSLAFYGFNVSARFDF